MTKQNAVLSIYISKEVRDRAKAVADSRRRSLSEYVVMLIERDLREVDRRKLEGTDVTQEVSA